MILLSEIVNGQRRTTPVSAPEFTKEYDVIVCGIGTAGSLAALFCAENGLSVLGIDPFTCVGGTHSAGLIGGNYFGCPGGRHQPLEDKILKFSKRYTFKTPETRKLLVEEALTESGAEILFEACACGIYLEDNTAIGLRILTSDGVMDCGAKVILDCTAEVFVATMAGCETRYGRASDGQTQPYTLSSMIELDGKYVNSNVDFGRVNQFDQWELAKAILFARSYKMEEESNGTTFIMQSPLLGIREGRRIVGEDTVRLEELFADKHTETPMFYSYSDLDKHGWDIAFDGETLGDWAIGANLGAYNVTVTVPYQSILPKGFEGLLVPCRGLDVDRDIASCVRMNRDMKKVAEVAAEWATLAVRENKKLRDVPYEALREKLVESGCLDEQYNRGCRIDGKKNWDGSPLNQRSVSWCTDPAMLKDGLKTECPGEAIWSAKRIGSAALPALLECLADEDEDLKKHAAFALASIGSNEANPILRDMVTSRDGFMLKDCRKNNNLRGFMAIYWLGRLGDRTITDELIRLICDPAELEKPIYRRTDVKTTRYKIAEFQDIYFHFVSQSVMALIRIGDMHRDLREKIETAFTQAFSTDEYYHRITKRPPLSSEGNMTQAIKNVAFLAVQHWQKQN